MQAGQDSAASETVVVKKFERDCEGLLTRAVGIDGMVSIGRLVVGDLGNRMTVVAVNELDAVHQLALRQ